MKYRPKHIAEYVLMRTLIVPIRILPYRAALFVGWTIAWLGYNVVGFRVGEAKRRVRQVFGERFQEPEVRQITWMAWRNFIFSIVDMIKLPSITAGWVKKHLINYDEMSKAVETDLKSGKGAIIASPHMGSPELGGVVMQLLGVPIFFITGKQKNPIVDAYINTLRGSTGIATIPRGSSLIKSVIRRLRDGEVLAFQPDVRSATEGIRVTFLGREANVVGGMALFARQTETPIVMVLAQRHDWTHHSYRLFPAVCPDPTVEKHEDWRRMTQQVFSMMEQEIRAHPEQWFWYNKRWILDPLEPQEAALPTLLFITPMFLFSGTFFPLESLPDWAQRVAMVLPLTHLSIISRETCLGFPAGGRALWSLLYLAIFAAAFFVVALVLMRRRLIK